MDLVQFRDILFGEIHPRGQMGLQAGQRLFFRRDLFRECAAKGCICQRSSLPAIGRDQVHHGFGLGQAQLSVQEGPPGIFAGSRRNCPGLDAALHQSPGHGAAAMAGQLDHILTGVAVGCAEEERHALVEGFLPFPKFSEQSGVALGIQNALVRVRRVEHPVRHSVAVRS